MRLLLRGLIRGEDVFIVFGDIDQIGNVCLDMQGIGVRVSWN